jgi:predicted nucleic acid-binding protein
MSETVVDSSVIVKWFLPEADSVQADRVLADVSAQGGRLVVLDIALVEVTHAIWEQFHRGLMSADDARGLLRDLQAAPA